MIDFLKTSVENPFFCGFMSEQEEADSLEYLAMLLEENGIDISQLSESELASLLEQLR